MLPASLELVRTYLGINIPGETVDIGVGYADCTQFLQLLASNSLLSTTLAGFKRPWSRVQQCQIEILASEGKRCFLLDSE